MQSGPRSLARKNCALEQGERFVAFATDTSWRMDHPNGVHSATKQRSSNFF